LGGEAPEFWKLDYKIGSVSDHVAKFHGDRPRDLGDYALEKEKKRNITGKTEDLPLLRTGGLTNIQTNKKRQTRPHSSAGSRPPLPKFSGYVEVEAHYIFHPSTILI